MTIKQMLVMYLITLAVFFLIDMVWLGVVAKGFYRRHLGSMLSPNVNWAAAILFYLLFIVGLPGPPESLSRPYSSVPCSA
jgi:uncharacterized membrane protein